MTVLAPSATSNTDWRSRVRAYVGLTKPRIIELLLVTTVPAMVLADKGVPSPWLVLTVLFGGTLAAAGANTINCVCDRDIDEKMKRTHGRPLPLGLVTPEHALRFGIALEIFAFIWLWATTNLLAATLAVGATAFYVFIYTMWLKRSTPQNIVIGGAAGAVPPLVAWAAVTGGLTGTPLYLFAIVFFWTPPHFWSLSLLMKDEYARAGVPMLPVVRGEAETRRQILLYAILLWAVTQLPFCAGGLGAVYLVSSLVLGGLFIAGALVLYRRADRRSALRLYLFSLAYLALLFGAMVLDVKL